MIGGLMKMFQLRSVYSDVFFYIFKPWWRERLIVFGKILPLVQSDFLGRRHFTSFCAPPTNPPALSCIALCCIALYCNVMVALHFTCFCSGPSSWAHQLLSHTVFYVTFVLGFQVSGPDFYTPGLFAYILFLILLPGLVHFTKFSLEWSKVHLHQSWSTVHLILLELP